MRTCYYMMIFQGTGVFLENMSHRKIYTGCSGFRMDRCFMSGVRFGKVVSHRKIYAGHSLRWVFYVRAILGRLRLTEKFMQGFMSGWLKISDVGFYLSAALRVL